MENINNIENQENVFNFKESAQAATLLAPIMVGRDKLSTDEILGKELTVIGFDFAPKFDQQGNPCVDQSTGEVDNFGVVIFAEYEDMYYSVGTVFTKVCKSWAAAFNGSAVDASDALRAQGGVKVKFTRGKSKQGRNLTNVEILN